MAAPEPDPVFVSSLQASLRKSAPPRYPFQVNPLQKIRFAWAVPVIILFIVTIFTLVVGPQKVWAAVRSLFGIIPGYGVVDSNTLIRGVETPVTQTRSGITITIDQGIATNEWTVVQFTVEGLTSANKTNQAEEPGCLGNATLVLPDNTVLTMSAAEGRGWASGYQFRSTFPPIPATVDHFSLLIPCLQETIPGSAPENWIFDLKLGAAPVDLKIIPLIDVPTPTPDPAQSTSVVPPAAETNDLGIQMVLEQVADLGTGYLLNGYLTWTDPNVWITAGGPFDIVLKDAGGQALPMEPYNDLSREEYDPTKILSLQLPDTGKRKRCSHSDVGPRFSLPESGYPV